MGHSDPITSYTFQADIYIQICVLYNKIFYTFESISHLNFINTLEDFFAFRRYENIASANILLTSNIFKTDIYM